ncbi:hypothetical protein LshimejAT787_0900820 [Lyophyllum shimeji]|uniref:Uncharacterized protein n=1 Tax=Lyophyllum shimeji TaxID=47721 RepID=A0A9P3PQL6_LYOSH|nr:hypothetical protein LshimejAT787_0900820 [Lyophyllum shimeji]
MQAVRRWRRATWTEPRDTNQNKRKGRTRLFRRCGDPDALRAASKHGTVIFVVCVRLRRCRCGGGADAEKGRRKQRE